MTSVAESDLLHMLMDNVPDAIYFKDLQSSFICINRALALRFGLSDPAEAVGKTDFDYFSEAHARQAYLDEQEVIRIGRPLVAREEAEYWPDGRMTWASTTKLPLRDRDGSIIGTCGISRDITYRKQTETALRRAKDSAEASLQHTRRIVDSAYDAYAAMDADGVIVDWNRQAELTFGWPRELAIDRLLHELLILPRFREAYRRVGDDMGLLRELIDVFLADCPRVWQKVRDALAEGDAHQLSRAAHALKGSVGNLAAHPACEAAQQLELLAAKGDLTHAVEAARKLELELERLKPVLRELELSAGK